MRDPEIRRDLRMRLLAEYSTDPTTLIIDELGICSGLARADMAVVNGELKGYEIKSERDSLDRLPSQACLYGKVFDTMTVVLGQRHLEKVKKSAPDWWGIVVADTDQRGIIEWQLVRSEAKNRDQDPLSVTQLLWRDEALHVLRTSGLAKGLVGRPRKYLWEALALNFCLSELRSIVRSQLKLRRNWRVAATQMQCDAKSPPSSKSSDSQSRPYSEHTH